MFTKKAEDVVLNYKQKTLLFVALYTSSGEKFRYIFSYVCNYKGNFCFPNKILMTDKIVNNTTFTKT